MGEEAHKVTLNVYDLSRGLARQLSASFLGKENNPEKASFFSDISLKTRWAVRLVMLIGFCNFTAKSNKMRNSITMAVKLFRALCSRMGEEAHKVTLNVYDLSRGLARQLSASFLGKVIEGVW
ncbi:hypothetical protein F2Q68_00018163 [Brassica cretica]|uniref:PPPDE domain-containing protein n=1 Tax=Brassica cretica TaxID=69181 RepID=A0A8S9HD96_BRACR|nr:hypothetical protein F2Q68_00018163 [Brassica cretica]